MKQNFIDAINEKELGTIRLFLSNELMLDPRGGSFNEMKEYAEANISNLYDVDDGKSYLEEPEKWTKELFFQVKNDLDFNFSQERLTLYERMAPVVLKDKIDALNYKEQRRLKMDENRQSCSSKSKQHIKVYKGVIAGSGVLTIAGIAIPKAWLTSMGVASVGLTKVLITSLGVVGITVGGLLLFKEYKNE
jgi:hypothetical protein